MRVLIILGLLFATSLAQTDMREDVSILGSSRRLLSSPFDVTKCGVDAALPSEITGAIRSKFMDIPIKAHIQGGGESTAKYNLRVDGGDSYIRNLIADRDIGEEEKTRRIDSFAGELVTRAKSMIGNLPDQRKAIFIGGAGGAGKSTALTKFKESFFVDKFPQARFDLKFDVDEYRQNLREYTNCFAPEEPGKAGTKLVETLKPKGCFRGAGFASQGPAGTIDNILLALAVNCGRSFVSDSTMGDFDWFFQNVFPMLKDQGYEISIVYVRATVEQQKQNIETRNDLEAKKSMGRQTNYLNIAAPNYARVVDGMTRFLDVFKEQQTASVKDPNFPLDKFYMINNQNGIPEAEQTKDASVSPQADAIKAILDSDKVAIGTVITEKYKDDPFSMNLHIWEQQNEEQMKKLLDEQKGRNLEPKEIRLLSQYAQYWMGEGKGQEFRDCAGQECRWHYAWRSLALMPQATQNIPWEARFWEVKLRYGEIPNLIEDNWHAVIRASPLAGALEKATAADPPAPADSAISVTMLNLVLETCRKIVTEAAAGGSYTNYGYGAAKGRYKSVDDLQMHDINQMLVKPLTRGLQLSWAHYFEDLKLNAKPAIGKIDYFISHEWRTPFQNFVTAVNEHCKANKCDPDTTYYWVCTFANNQHHINLGDNEHPESGSVFAQALLQSKGVLAIEPPVSQYQLTIGRCWCMFEMYVAVRNDKPITLWCPGDTSGSKTPLINVFEKGSKVQGTVCANMKVAGLSTLQSFAAGFVDCTNHDDFNAIINAMANDPNPDGFCQKVGVTDPSTVANIPTRAKDSKTERCLSKLMRSLTEEGGSNGVNSPKAEPPKAELGVGMADMRAEMSVALADQDAKESQPNPSPTILNSLYLVFVSHFPYWALLLVLLSLLCYYYMATLHEKDSVSIYFQLPDEEDDDTYTR